MEKIKIFVLGPENPCSNCKKVKENAKVAVRNLSTSGLEFEVIPDNIASKENLDKFGLLRSPAVVARDCILFQGEVPTAEQIKRKLEDLIALL